MGAAKLVAGRLIVVRHFLDHFEDFGLAVGEAFDFQHSLLALGAAPEFVGAARIAQDQALVPVSEYLFLEGQQFSYVVHEALFKDDDAGQGLECGKPLLESAGCCEIVENVKLDVRFADFA